MTDTTTMTDAEINERLARFCGWEPCRKGSGWQKPDRPPAGTSGLVIVNLANVRGDPPDYLHDGNAMLELLEALRSPRYDDPEYVLEIKIKRWSVEGVMYWTAKIYDPSGSVDYAAEHTLPRAVALAAMKVIGDGDA